MGSVYLRLSSNNYQGVPTGGATASNQLIEISYLQNIDTGVQSANTTLVSIDNEMQAANITLVSIDSNLDSALTLLTSIDSKLVQGQQTSANSLSVVLASDQPAIPVIPIEEPYVNTYVFNEISSVPSGSETTIASYTVPAGKTASLHLCETSGTNIGTFNLYLGTTLINRKRTYFGGELNATMEFTNKGYQLTAGQTITLKVIHNRPSPGDFEANLQIKESV